MKSRDAVFKIKEDLFKKLDFESTKIRDKKVVRFERANVKQIDIKICGHGDFILPWKRRQVEDEQTRRTPG